MLVERILVAQTLLLHDAAQLRIQTDVASLAQSFEDMEDRAISSDTVLSIVPIPKTANDDQDQAEDLRQRAHFNDQN